MKKSIIIVLIIIVILALFFLLFNKKDGAGAGKGEGGSEVAESDSSIAPVFELNDYSGSLVSSTEFKDKILVVNAWATWCPFCVDELPDFKLLQEAFPNEIAVIAINRAEPKATAKSFSDNLGLSESYTFLLDPNDTFYKSIGGFSMPETIFISPKGKLLQHKRGPFKFPEMKEIVDGLLIEN